MLGYTILTLFNARKNSAAFDMIFLLTDLKLKTPREFQGIHSWDFSADCDMENIEAVKKMNPILFIAVLKGLLRAGFVKSATYLSYKTQNQRDRVCSTMIEGLIRYENPDFDRIAYYLEEIDEMGGMLSPSACAGLVRTFARNGKKDLAMKYFCLYLELKKGFDLIAYTLLVRCSLEFGSMQNPNEILDEMIKENINPDSKFFVYWMRTAHRENNIEGVLQAFNKAKELIGPCLNVYSEIILIRIKQGQFGDAESLLSEMCSFNIIPNANILRPLMEGYLRAGNFSRAMYYYGLMIGYDFVGGNGIPDLGISPDCQALWTMLRFLIQNNMIEQMELVFRKTILNQHNLPVKYQFIIVSKLLEAGYTWPVLMIPSFRIDNDRHDTLNLALKTLQLDYKLDPDQYPAILERFLAQINLTDSFEKRFHDFQRICFSIVGEGSIEVGEPVMEFLKKCLVYSVTKQITDHEFTIGPDFHLICKLFKDLQIEPRPALEVVAPLSYREFSFRPQTRRSNESINQSLKISTPSLLESIFPALSKGVSLIDQIVPKSDFNTMVPERYYY
jgi:pentatricopeptide repeat protein